MAGRVWRRGTRDVAGSSLAHRVASRGRKVVRSTKDGRRAAAVRAARAAAVPVANGAVKAAVATCRAAGPLSGGRSPPRRNRSGHEARHCSDAVPRASREQPRCVGRRRFRSRTSGGGPRRPGILARAYREGRLDRRMRVYLAPKVLIIDEMGYLPLDDMGATIFFQLVSARYERGSIILTSNKSYGDWGSIFGDPIIATAILDRLLHHSTTINIRGESYRLKDRRKAGLFPRAEEEADRPAPFPSTQIVPNGPRRQGSAAPRKTGAPLTAPGRSGNGS